MWKNYVEIKCEIVSFEVLRKIQYLEYNFNIALQHSFLNFF